MQKKARSLEKPPLCIVETFSDNELLSKSFEKETIPIYSQSRKEIQSDQLSGQYNDLSPRHFRKVDEAIRYLQRKFTEHISAVNLSMEVSLSVQKLQTGLKTRTGLTLIKLQEKIRIDTAKELLRDTSLSIKDISKKVGFKTQSHFGTIFKHHTGVTPFKYREQFGH